LRNTSYLSSSAAGCCFVLTIASWSLAGEELRHEFAELVGVMEQASVGGVGIDTEAGVGQVVGEEFAS
jgi:hypothetical protein